MDNRQVVEAYQVVTANSYTSLSHKVEEFLQTAWHPFGGVAVTTYGLELVYAQAVVRYKKEK